MSNLTQQGNQEAKTLKGKEETKHTLNLPNKSSRSKKKKQIKPTGFKELEALAKEIVEANGGS